MIDRVAPNEERRLIRRSVALLIAIGMIILVTGWAANGWKKSVGVKDIHVSGARILPAKDIVTLADVDRSQKLFDVDVNAIRRRIEASPYVESAAITRDIPGIVTIAVHERVPVVAVIGAKTVYLDDSARVLPPVKTTQIFDLPVLTGAVPSDECVAGKRIHAAPVLRALALLDTARTFGDDLYHRISEVHINDDGSLICYTAESGIPIAFGQGGFALKLAKLDGFWKEFVVREGAPALEYVDLRFDDIVVARWNQRQELAMHERENP